MVQINWCLHRQWHWWRFQPFHCSLHSHNNLNQPESVDYHLDEVVTVQHFKVWTKKTKKLYTLNTCAREKSIQRGTYKHKTNFSHISFAVKPIEFKSKLNQLNPKANESRSLSDCMRISKWFVYNRYVYMMFAHYNSSTSKLSRKCRRKKSNVRLIKRCNENEPFKWFFLTLHANLKCI